MLPVSISVSAGCRRKLQPPLLQHSNLGHVCVQEQGYTIWPALQHRRTLVPA